MLRRALREAGIRGYRVDPAHVIGRPDLVFSKARVLIFCDGDFWHGRDLEQRIARLRRGHNALYWVAKIEGNVARDRRNDAELAKQGWIVLRYWESTIRAAPEQVVQSVRRALASKR